MYGEAAAAVDEAWSPARSTDVPADPPPEAAVSQQALGEVAAETEPEADAGSGFSIPVLDALARSAGTAGEAITPEAFNPWMRPRARHGAPHAGDPAPAPTAQFLPAPADDDAAAAEPETIAADVSDPDADAEAPAASQLSQEELDRLQALLAQFPTTPVLARMLAEWSGPTAQAIIQDNRRSVPGPHRFQR